MINTETDNGVVQIEFVIIKKLILNMNIKANTQDKEIEVFINGERNPY